MRQHGAILLLSCYELGHQPLSLASPLALLRRARYDPIAVDTSVSALNDDALRAARLVAISVPMHTELRLGTRVAERVRACNADARICFYGLYAALNADYLLRHHADSTIGGEYEAALVALAGAVRAAAPAAVPGVRTRPALAAPVLARVPLAAPPRERVPPPQSHAQLVRGRAGVPG